MLERNPVVEPKLPDSYKNRNEISTKCYSIDYDVREIIEDFIATAAERDIIVKLKRESDMAGGREKIYSEKLDKWVFALPAKNNLLPVS